MPKGETDTKMSNRWSATQSEREWRHRAGREGVEKRKERAKKEKPTRRVLCAKGVENLEEQSPPHRRLFFPNHSDTLSQGLVAGAVVYPAVKSSRLPPNIFYLQLLWFLTHF